MSGVLAILVSAFALLAAQDRGTIREVVFEGESRISPSMLRAQLKTRVGEVYSEAAANDDIKALWQRFQVQASIQATPLEDGGFKVVITLQDVDPIRTVEFEGNDALSDDDLREALGLSRRGTLTAGILGRGQMFSMARRLRDHYVEEGYLYCEVEGQLVRRGEEWLLAFQILEGPKVKVNDIYFEGLVQFSAGDVEDLMETEESWWFLTETFKREALDRDVVKIEQFLQDEGYLDARVAVEAIEPSGDYDEVDVVLRIDQGERYRIGKVEFSGNESFTEAELSPLLKLGPRDFYRKTVYGKDRRRLTKFYGQRGYIRAFIPVEPVLTFESTDPVVNLTWEIRENGVKRIRDVRIVGNENTADEVVRRTLRFYPGEIFDRDKLNDAQDRLRASGFFADAQGIPRAWVEPVQTEDPDYEDVLVQVEDGPSGMMNFLAGVSSGTGFFVGISIEKQNFDLFDLPSSPWAAIPEFLNQKAFHGGGQNLRLRANPGNRQAFYEIAFTEPYLTGPIENPVFLDVSGRIFERYRRLYDEKRLGGTVRLGKRINLDTTYSVGIRNERVDISDVTEKDPPIEDYEEAEGKTSIRSLLGRFTWRRLDSLMNPTDGMMFESNSEFSGGFLGAEVDQFKLWNVGEFLYPIYENDKEQRHVLQTRGTVAYANEFGDTDSIPFYERFFAGGTGSLLQMRGFDYRGMGPHQSGEPVGGEGAVVVNFDYVFPVLDTYNAELREDIPFLRGILFVDQGMLEPDWEDLPDGVWRISAGIGVRLRIPIPILAAPLELYYGFPIQKDDQDERQAFTLNFSTRF